VEFAGNVARPRFVILPIGHTAVPGAACCLFSLFRVTRSPLTAPPDKAHSAKVSERPAASADSGRHAAARVSRWEFVVVFLIALVAISVARWDVLHSPPWQDQATGLWTEADFLAETRFDFWRLRYQENHYFDQPSAARSCWRSPASTR
jgi:hypothetical protein